MHPTTTITARLAVALLWRKSILLNTRGIIFYAAMIILYLGWWAHTSGRPTPYLVIGSLMVALIPVTILAKEHKDGGVRLTCSLPVTRRTIVAANLSLAWLLALIGVLVMFGLPLIPGLGRAEPGHLLTGGNVLLVLAVLTLAFLFMHPALIRFGPVGLLLGLAAMQVLGTVVFVLTATGTIRGGVHGFVGSICSTMNGLRVTLGSLGFIVAVLVVVALVNACTYALSLGLYRRLEA